MASKGHPQTPAEKAAASRNIKRFWAENPAGANLKHGAKSEVIRKRYSDPETPEGKTLAEVMEQFEEFFGGPSEITPAMRVVLWNVRSKLIVSWQLGAYMDMQPALVNDDGESVPCLKMFLQTSESLRRDLEKLTEMATKRPTRTPTLDDIMKAAPGPDEDGKGQDDNR